MGRIEEPCLHASLRVEQGAARSVRHEYHVGKYIQTCMAAHGYAWHLSDNRCLAADFEIEANPYCYVPDTLLGRILYRIETGDNSN